MIILHINRDEITVTIGDFHTVPFSAPSKFGVHHDTKQLALNIAKHIKIDPQSLWEEHLVHMTAETVCDIVLSNQLTDSLYFCQQFTLQTIPTSDIQHSSTHGFGLFTQRAIAPGMTLCKLDGQILDTTEYAKLNRAYQGNPLALYGALECNYLGDKVLCRQRTSYSFINHHKQPNLKIINLNLMAMNPIEAGEELFLDYTAEKLPHNYLSQPRNQYLVR